MFPGEPSQLAARCQTALGCMALRRHNSHNWFWGLGLGFFEETTVVLSSNCIDFLLKEKPMVHSLDVFTVPIYVQPLC